MKGSVNKIAALVALALMGLISGSLSAQTYTGYLKPVDSGLKGVDSLHITIELCQSGERISSVGLSGQDLGKFGTRGYYSTPWMASVKTNLLSDIISIPYAGVEVQLAKKLSLDLSGWFSKWNAFYPDEQTMLYGAAPELRWWIGDQTMKKGHFVGLHGMVAWYTFAWRDGDGNKVIYQNGKSSLKDTGSTTPAWSCGATYGYALPLDKKGRLGFEFYLGLGYSRYQQKCITTLPDGKVNYIHEDRDRVGVTKVGVSLAYRFSLRRYKER